MAQKTKGMRNKTRKKLSKHVRDKDTVNTHLKSFDTGDRVDIVIESSIHRGIPDPKFHGRSGSVLEKRGRAFVVGIEDGDKIKEVPVYPAHLQEVSEE